MKEFSVKDKKLIYTFYFKGDELERLTCVEQKSQNIINHETEIVIFDEYRLPTNEAQYPINKWDLHDAVKALCYDYSFDKIEEFFRLIQKTIWKDDVITYVGLVIKKMNKRSGDLTLELALSFRDL